MGSFQAASLRESNLLLMWEEPIGWILVRPFLSLLDQMGVYSSYPNFFWTLQVDDEREREIDR